MTYTKTCIIIALIALVVPKAVAGNIVPGNIIHREITCVSNEVYVEDVVRVQAEIAIRDPILNAVFEEVQTGKTNALAWCKSLVEGEALEVKKCDVTTNGQFVAFHIISTVKFGDGATPAQIRWVPSFGGQSFTFTNGVLGRTGKGLEILVYRAGENFYLKFPELGKVTDTFLDRLDDLRRAWDFMFSGTAVEYTCTLKQQNHVEKLFNWNQENATSVVKESADIKRMARAGEMSLNDYYSLYSNFKMAKPGWYEINSN